MKQAKALKEGDIYKQRFTLEETVEMIREMAGIADLLNEYGVPAIVDGGKTKLSLYGRVYRLMLYNERTKPPLEDRFNGKATT